MQRLRPGLTALPLLICLLAGAAPDSANPWAEAAASALPDLAAGRPAPPTLLGAALAGRWSGTLTYRDYRSERRVVLPTSASIAGTSSALQLELVYDDGPGKTVRASQRWALVGDGFSMEQDGAPLAVTAYRSDGDQAVTLVALGDGTDNGAAVQVRVVVQRRGDQLEISRATRLPDQPWLLRHIYRLTPAK